jgi:DNA-binding response OmpR family regulator
MNLSAPRKRLLLADDDSNSAGGLAAAFELVGEFDVRVVSSAADALNAVRDGTFDVLLLEVELPDMDGRDLCRLLRRQLPDTPILMLTGLQAEADIILGLESGATDYVAKPIKFGELLARLRAHLREASRDKSVVLAIGPASFDPARKELTSQRGAVISLTDMEAAILLFLCSASDGAVSRAQLLAGVWGYNEDAETHTVESNIYRLRRKLKAAIPNIDVLATEKTGYRLRR